MDAVGYEDHPMEVTADAGVQNAVEVRGGCKSLGKGSAYTKILDRLDMKVPKGCIYGLLGASGCGKTTLLSCIVGRRALDEGSVWVLGGSPGSEESGIPGNRLGYMPQELALMEEFTIRETFLFFSWIYGVSAEDLQKKIAVLDDVLRLPAHTTLIKHLSTGQQRRVSLGAALLHDPELLVLDEPTVGVDPILRQRIWDHLLDLTSKANRTIIVTTHYIEEARQADYVGLMRGGRLVAESSPSNLLQTHNADTLETVFLELCRRQDVVDDCHRDDGSSEGEGPAVREDVVLQALEVKHSQSERRPSMEIQKDADLQMTEVPRHRHLKAMNRKVKDKKHGRKSRKTFSTLYGEWKAMHFKNLIRFIRNPGVLGFVFGFPIFQIVLYFLAIGGDPHGIAIAVVNQEMSFQGGETSSILRPIDCSEYSSENLCNDTAVSCKYLHTLTTSEYMTAEIYSDPDSAINAVRRGKVWGAVVIPENFTRALTARREDREKADRSLIDTGDVQIHLDMSNHQLSTLLQRRLLKDLEEIYMGFITGCGLDEKLASTPLRINDPIFGVREPTFRSFTMPAVIITTIFFLAVGLTVTILVTERVEGSWDRLMVMGVAPWQLLQSHLEWQIFLICGQILEVAVLIIYIYQVEIRGSIFMVLLHMFLQGMNGMSFGFVISIFSRHVSEANYIASGSFIPMIVLSGAMWPLEGMPFQLRYMSYAMPSTMATESLRSIMFRGWGIEMPTVYLGFVITSAWIAFFMVSCWLLLKYKKL